MKTEDHVKVFSSTDELVLATANYIISQATKAVQERGRFVISLSGGETPKQLFAALAKAPLRDQMPWGKIFFFWGDERCVPLTDERNNAHQAKLILFDQVNAPASNIHRIPVDLSPEKAATAYEKDLADFFGGAKQQFDLMLLGLGENAHTASLFPGTPVIHEKLVGVRSVYVKEDDMFRVSMTAPLINLSRSILFLVTGIKKAATLRNVLKAPYDPDKFPAQLIKPVDGELQWFTASNAALLL
ncbi:MAG TPA: 6-phosphogluconolactonase [Cyclobacteriaceae bacterium]|jgi:6-phosphogluconolactonase|nr:6-phosphogluconolactonase [Cyclobacteriaceae bacterium]